MFAEKALSESPNGMIVEETAQGLVTISRESTGQFSGIVFHLGFIPKDAGGRIPEKRIAIVGSYDDLDVAITIAAVKFGCSEKRWVPVSGIGDWRGSASNLKVVN